MHTSCYFSANSQLNEAQNFDKIRHKCYKNTELVRQSINIAVYNKILAALLKFPGFFLNTKTTAKNGIRCQGPTSSMNVR